MEIVLEHDEVDSLLREALAARGLAVPDDAELAVRQNKKRYTLRVVYRWGSAEESTDDRITNPSRPASLGS